MPGGRHADQHDHQRYSRPDRAPDRPRRRGRTVRLGSIALAAAFALLVATAAIRAASNGGDIAALSALSCSSAPRLAADTAAVTTPLGANASGPSQLATATSEFGHMPVIRVYYTAVPSPSEWSSGVLAINHSSVVLSFDPSPARILSGADDAALAHFFDAAPTGNAIYYSYYAEPESYIRKGQFTLAQYKAAWAHIVAIADAAHNPYLHSTLILQGQDGRAGDEYNFRDYLPAGGVISTIGWDAYPNGAVEAQTPQQTAPADFMGPDVAAAKSVGLPFGFAEFALGTSAGQPQWLTDVANYLQSNGALFGTLFDATGFPWMVLRDSASIQAWRAAVARSASGRPVVDPLSHPAPPAPTPTKTTPAATTPAPTPTKSTPAAAPSKSPSPTASPSPRGLVITRLTITPSALTTPLVLPATGASHVRIRLGHVRIRFKLSQAADVSICVLNSQGDLVRELDRPGLPAGWATQRYYGYDLHHRLLPAGRYQVLVMASNAKGSATAERGLIVTGRGCDCALHRPIRRQ
jgi:hypothetical protein